MQPGPANPRGYWETRSIRHLGDSVLQALGSTWKAPPLLTDGWEVAGELDPFRVKAGQIIESLFPSDGHVGWKDPRNSLLLPFWRTAVPVFATVMVIRDPRFVASSLARRNGLDPDYAAYLWLRYTSAAWSADPHRLVVRYADLFERADEIVDEMACFLGLPRPSDAVRLEIASATVRDLRHDEAADDGGPQMRHALELFREIDAGSQGATRLVEEAQSGWLAGRDLPSPPVGRT
jgi:hypothetical protein